jgi:hypothetical protein
MSADPSEEIRVPPNPLTEEQMVAGARAIGMPEPAIGHLTALYGVVRAGYAAGVTPDFEKVTGRLHAQEAGNLIYVHPSGNDTNPGMKDRPLKTSAGAAQRGNASTGSEAVSIILSEGVCAINEPALFRPANRSFTKTVRLAVRAEVPPDDPDWSPQSIPVQIHTMPLSPNWMGRPNPLGGVSHGMQFETSHATAWFAIQ